MKGRERLRHLDSSTPRMARALPDLPMDMTILVRLMRISFFGMGHYFEPVFRGLDVSEHGFHVLCLLAAADNAAESPTELSEMVGTSRANMTRMLSELEAGGYVSRATATRDGRRQIATLTAAGRRKVREVVAKIAAPLQSAFGELDDEECAVLNRLLRKLIVSFDNGAHAMRSVA